MLIIGLGMISEYSLMRIPRPPQKRTTFMGSFVRFETLYQQRAASLRRDEQIVRAQRVGGRPDAVEGETRPVRDVEERGASIGQVEHPEHRHRRLAGIRQPPDRPVEAAPAELGLAPGLCVAI